MLQLGHVLNDLDGTMYTGGACPRSDNVVLRRALGAFRASSTPWFRRVPNPITLTLEISPPYKPLGLM